MHAIAICTALLSLAVVPGMPAGIQQRENRSSAPGVAGTWTMTVKGTGAHGDLTAGLVLAQEGGTVTGTFTAHGNEHAVRGEFNEGTLTFATTQAQGDQQLTFTAKLKSDGTLVGYVSGPMGDMQWTATRVKAEPGAARQAP